MQKSDAPKPVALGKPIDPDEKIDYFQFETEQQRAADLAGLSYHWLQRRLIGSDWRQHIRETAWKLGYRTGGMINLTDARPRHAWALLWQVALADLLSS